METPSANKMQLQADLMLVLVTLFWGASYYLVSISLAEVEPFTMNAIRFLLAFVVAAVFTWPRLRRISRDTIRYAAILGGILMVVYFGATYGIRYTSISNAGFLCALPVVITPIFGYIFKKQQPSPKLKLAVLMALAGIALLTLNAGMKPAVGDLFCLSCSVSYAVHLLVIETAVRKPLVNAYQLGVLQLGFAGVFQLLVACLAETPRLPQTANIWGAVLFLSIFCTGIAFIVQTIAQQYTSASHVGVIFTLEPVFSGFVAFFIAGEILSPRNYLGAAILLASLLVMEVNWKKRPFRKRPTDA